MQSLTVAVWNAEWAEPNTIRGRAVQAVMFGQEADIFCLTETYEDLMPDDGYAIFSERNYGYRVIRGRRKVALWSRKPWECVDSIGMPELPPGRFVSGISETPVGRIRVIGVCMPSRDAHVRTGRKDRKSWQEHREFLHGLAAYLAQTPRDMLTLLVGDFNQRAPRIRTPLDVCRQLKRTLSGFVVPTAGEADAYGRQVIDHMAFRGDLVVDKVSGWSGCPLHGPRLSNHDGVRVTMVP